MRIAWLLPVALIAAGLCASPTPAVAASPEPVAPDGLTMSAEPMLGGSYRPESWMAVLVRLENHGEAIVGELRLSSSVGSSPTFSLAVDLPTGSRQEHIMYGQVVAVGRSRLELVSGTTVLHRVDLTLDTKASRGLRTYVIAEHPERLVGDLTDALSRAGRIQPSVISIAPAGLPPRSQAWSSIDLLVWQDADSQVFEGQRGDALRTWLATGGHLLIVGGSTGLTSLRGFAGELLPFAPEFVVDVPVADFEVFGAPPGNAAAVPAVIGRAHDGRAVEVLATTGGSTMAARIEVGRGSVTLVGFDPQTLWLTESPVGAAVWSRILPPTIGPANAAVARNDSYIVGALADIPAVQLPDLFLLFVLMVAYVVAIGPLNYVILRRRDRRELAWLTIPLTIIGFALGAYVFGALLRGPNVVVNELAIVRGATGADRGLAQVYVGVFSPNRATYDVKVGGAALVSAPLIEDFGPSTTRAIDVLQGDPSTIRRFGVNFGSLRAFTALADVTAPRVDAELRIVGDSLTGTLTNSSTESLSGVSVVYGRAVAHVGDIGPGETRSIDLSTTSVGQFQSMAQRLVPLSGANDPATLRSLAARRAIVDHLDGGWESGSGVLDRELAAAGPMIVGFRPDGPLEVSLAGSAESVGETLYLLSARVMVTGPVSLAGSLVQGTVVAIDSFEYFEDRDILYLSRGTLAVDYRPTGLNGTFQATGLTIRLGATAVTPGTDGDELLPLPPGDQPDPDSPLAVNPRPDELGTNLPRLQLFDLIAQTWVEFEPIQKSQTYRIADPGRWLDVSGTLHVRFVVRGAEALQFGFEPRISGNVE